MRPPLEYGDNFPVPTGSWNPAIPWRFPNREIRLKRPSLLGLILPWLTLGLGITLGVLWTSWRSDGGAAAKMNSVQTEEAAIPQVIQPSAQPVPRSPAAPAKRLKSDLA